MKILRFKTLSLTNFLSIGKTPLVLNFQDGLNLITGYNKDDTNNKNGIGKSSICDGLFFVLFNETIKNLKKGEIINDKNKKKCSVVLEFDIEDSGVISSYKITRNLAPSSCTFEIDGEDVTLSTIPKTNQDICNRIGVSKDVFRQSIIMSIGNSTAFFNQSAVDKRKFIEGVFNLEIFSSMLSDSRSGYNDSKKTKDSIGLKLKTEQGRLVEYTDRDNNFEEVRDEAVTTLKTEIKYDIVKIKELITTIKPEDSSEELQSRLSKLDDKIKLADGMLLKVSINASKVSDDISALRSEIVSNSDICSACQRPYDNIDEIREMKLSKEAKIVELTVDNDKFIEQKSLITSKKADLIKSKTAIQSTFNDINTVIAGNKSVRDHMNTLKAKCKANKVLIDTKTAETSDFKDLIVTTTLEIVDIEAEYKDETTKNKVYEICKFILSEEGVKSIIIKRLKSLLNSKMAEYLEMLDSQITCEFDEYFTETIYNKYGVEKSYDAFSGGESKRIDLAILLTFQDILRTQSGVDIQLAFYDEILDSSIDEVGRMKVLQILKDKSEKTPIYIISHRSKMSDLIDNEIILEKQNDFTYLKEN